VGTFFTYSIATLKKQRRAKLLTFQEQRMAGFGSRP